MTLGELRAELIRLIQYASDYDPNTPNATYDRILNRAYLRVCHRMDEVYERRTVAVAANQAVVSVPGMRAVHRVWWVVGEVLQELRRVVEPVWSSWLTVRGQPLMYEVVGDDLWLYPRSQTAGQLYVEGRYDPAPLVNDSDSPVVSAMAQEALLKLAYALWLERYPERAQERVLLEREVDMMLQSVLAEQRAARWTEPLLNPLLPPPERWRLGQ